MNKNKICGGCRYFEEEVNYCERFECDTREHSIACNAFKPIEELKKGYVKMEEKLNNKRIKRIYDPIFRQTFLVYIGYDFQVFFEEVTAEQYKGNPDVLNGYTINTDVSEICIWVRDIDNLPAVVHELVHATQYALYDRCYVDRREAELPAYYIEFLLAEILKKEVEDE